MSTTLTDRRAAWRWLAVSLVALGVGWFGSSHPLPVYDGINAPDEPYRYVSGPAGAPTTAPPTRGQSTAPAVGGLNVEQLLAVSGETGPQVQAVLPKLAVQAPTGARTISLVVLPVAPDVQPTVGPVDGNVYRLQLSSDAGPASLRPDQSPGAIRLRATSDSQPGPVVVHRDSASAAWTTLATTRVGNDIYQADLVGLGDYALAFRPQDAPQTAASPRSGGVSAAALVVIGLLGVSVVVGAVLALRRRGGTP